MICVTYNLKANLNQFKILRNNCVGNFCFRCIFFLSNGNDTQKRFSIYKQLFVPKYWYGVNASRIIRLSVSWVRRLIMEIGHRSVLGAVSKDSSANCLIYYYYLYFRSYLTKHKVQNYSSADFYNTNSRPNTKGNKNQRQKVEKDLV